MATKNQEMVLLAIHLLKEGGNPIKLIWLVVSLIPSPFLFHCIEIAYSPGPAILLSGTLVIVIVAGLLSAKINVPLIILINIITILISVVLGAEFITPSNPSWFNPFGRNFAIIATGIVMLIGVLLVRLFIKIIIDKRQ